MNIEARVQDLTSSIQQEVEKIDTELAELQARRDQIATAPVPKKEAVASADSAINLACDLFLQDSRYSNALRTFTRPAPDDGRRALPTFLQSRYGTDVDDQALFYFLKETIHARVTEDLEDLYQTLEPGLSSSARAAELKKIDQEMEALEAHREVVADQIRRMFSQHVIE